MKNPGFLQAWKEYRRFQKLEQSARELVLYSEGPSYWLHLKAVVQGLLDESDLSFSYVSSDLEDPGLRYAPERIHSFCVGQGFFRTMFFSGLSAKVLAMTMPDLESFHIKRSRHAPVRYLYIHHSPVSTHMVYRPEAFDHFDEIFCAGPHHELETRARERLFKLKEKELFKHGYGRLDDLLLDKKPEASAPGNNEPLWVTVAPTWGTPGLLESCGKELAGILLDNGFKVTVRPHPRTRLTAPRIIADLQASYGGHRLFNIEDDAKNAASINEADLMISDWSGAAFDFAFVRLRPVLFIDTPRKVNNPDYAQLEMEPLEASIREEIGAIVAPENLHEMPELVRRLCASPAAFAEQIQKSRQKWIYNPGASGRAGARRLLEILKER